MASLSREILWSKITTATGPTVLMIEDHSDTACLVQIILERNGYAVRHAPDGWNAKHLTETSDPPSLVLLDISLPGLSGLRVLSAIRMSPKWRRVPVIVLTADTHSDSKVEATNLGAMAYLTKPFSKERLMQAVEQFLPRPNGE